MDPVNVLILWLVFLCVLLLIGVASSFRTLGRLLWVALGVFVVGLAVIVVTT